MLTSIRVLIVGWDGATWTVARPLLEQGRLPNLARLMATGVRATLQSIEPTLSPIVWTSIATGKRPEKHGVTRFLDTANELRSRRIWDIVASPERPVGIFGWPVTWPPPSLPGFVIPSLFERANDTHPPELRFVREMETGLQATWRKRIALTAVAMRHGLRMNTLGRIFRYFAEARLSGMNESDHFLRQRVLKLHVQCDLYTELVRRYQPWFASFYLNQIDAFSHRFWRYLEPERFPVTTEDEVQRYKDEIPHAYEMADQALGRILRLTDENTLVCVLSDHGFEASHRAKQGVRDFKGQLKGREILRFLGLDQEISYVRHRRWLVLSFNRHCSAARKEEITELLRSAWVPEIDLPMFIVTKDTIGSLTLKIHGAHVFDRRDLSELTVVWPDAECRFTDMVQPHYDLKRSGIHHLDGIMVLNGPGIKRRPDLLLDASVLDLTPTLLALLGFPVGEDMDGTVLTEAIQSSFLDTHPTQTIETHDAGLLGGTTEEEEEVPEEVLQRLRELGYID